MFIRLIMFMKEISSNLVVQNALQSFGVMVYSHQQKGYATKKWS